MLGTIEGLGKQMGFWNSNLSTFYFHWAPVAVVVNLNCNELSISLGFSLRLYVKAAAHVLI